MHSLKKENGSLSESTDTKRKQLIFEELSEKTCKTRILYPAKAALRESEIQNNYMDCSSLGDCGGMGLISSLAQCVKGSGVAVVVAWIQSLAQELPHAKSAYEKILHITNYQRNATQNCNEVQPYQSEWPSLISLQRTNAGEGVEKREPSPTLLVEM